MTMPHDDVYDGFQGFEGDCYACDMFDSLDDLGLCGGCSAKLDRDMIRQRAWAYSATAFCVRPEKYEELRTATIAQYGSELELIVDESKPKKPRRARRRKKKRRR